MLSPTQIIKIIKNITAKEIYRLYSQIKKKLWGGNIWSTGYFVSTVGRNGNENQTKNYVRIKGKNTQKYIGDN